MGSVTANRWLALGALLLVSGLLIGCTTGGVRAPNASPALTPDGLVSSPTPSGLLFIRPDHNIGGYDQVFFEPIYISYRDGRKALGAKDQAALLTALERGERERAEQAGIAIASMRSPCVMSMRFSIVDLDLNEVGSINMSQTIYVASMGTVTLVVDIWDSKSGKALLRFAQRRKILGGNTLGPPPSRGDVPAQEDSGHYARRFRKAAPEGHTPHPPTAPRLARVQGPPAHCRGRARSATAV